MDKSTMIHLRDLYQPGQKIWWWSTCYLELQEGTIDKVLYLDGFDYKWQIATDSDSLGNPFHLKVHGSNIYATLQDARVKLTRILYDKANAAVAEAKRFDEAHLKLLRI